MKAKQKELARSLRRQGLSLKAIKKQVPVALSSISVWTRDIELTENQVAILAAPVGREKAVQRIKELRVERWQSYREDAKQAWKTLSKDPEFMFGLALYVGEGDKSNSSVRLTNTNPAVLKSFQKWLLSLGVSLDEMKCNTYLHPEDSEQTARAFWCKTFGVDPAKVYVYKKPTPVSSKSLKKNKHVHGIASIYLGSTALAQKIKTWMKLALGEKSE